MRFENAQRMCDTERLSMGRRRHNRSSPEVEARVIELAKGGELTQRQIADTVVGEGLVGSLSQMAVSKILRRARAAGEAIPRGRGGRVPRQRLPELVAVASGGRVTESGAILDAPEALPPEPLPVDDTAAGVLRERLNEVRAMMHAARQRSMLSEYARLATVERGVAKDLAAIEPPIAIDPEKDPDNLEARRLLVARIEQLVSAAEARVVGGV